MVERGKRDVKVAFVEGIYNGVKDETRDKGRLQGTKKTRR